jgi:hypothetical protein
MKKYGFVGFCLPFASTKSTLPPISMPFMVAESGRWEKTLQSLILSNRVFIV